MAPIGGTNFTQQAQLGKLEKREGRKAPIVFDHSCCHSVCRPEELDPSQSAEAMAEFGCCHTHDNTWADKEDVF